MKVLVLGIRGIPGVQGGVETHAEQLYPRIASLSCDVEVIVRTPFVERGTRSFGAIRLRRIWSPRRTGVEALVHSLLGVLYAGLTRPDILHIHAVGPALVVPLARLLGLRVVMTHHGPDYDRDKWGPMARRVLRLGERLGVRFSNARIVISSVIAGSIERQFDRDSVLIPNGVAPVAPTLATDALDRLGLEAGRYFLNVGRMVPEKRQLDLIRAFVAAAVPGWKLVLVGGLDTSDYCRQVQAAARESGAVLTGFVKGGALDQLYSHAGGFVLPSTHEGLPIALLEALGFGLPAVASDIPANLEVALDASSYFHVGNVSSLAAALKRMVANPPDAAARAERRRLVAERYDWDRIAAPTMQVYLAVLRDA